MSHDKSRDYGLDEKSYRNLYGGVVVSQISDGGTTNKTLLKFNEVTQYLEIFKKRWSNQTKEKDRICYYHLEDLESLTPVFEQPTARISKSGNYPFALHFSGRRKLVLKCQNNGKRNQLLNELILLIRNQLCFLGGTQELKRVFNQYCDISVESGEASQVLSVSESDYKMSFEAFQRYLVKDHKWETASLEEITKITKGKNFLTYADFLDFMNSPYGDILCHDYAIPYCDMSRPLNEYYCFASHNTYLLADQLVGPSSCEAYAYALLIGCRCVELDVWDGAEGVPIIYHGHTKTSKILFRDVIETIKKFAFVVSPYPVILSLENHTSHAQQMIMSQYFDEVFGGALFTTTVSSLPSPEDLKYKFVLKGKGAHSKKAGDQTDGADSEDDYDSDEAAEAPSDLLDQPGAPQRFKITEELKKKVVICRSVKFVNFQHARNNSTSLDISSFDEQKVESLSSSQGSSFADHTHFQLVRTYPAGKRVDSSNYNPVTAWSVGCQLVALNTQTPTAPLQICQGLFRMNDRRGYILKPDVLRRQNSGFDPCNAQTFGVGLRVTFRIISGYKLYNNSAKSGDKGQKLDRYVSIKVYGPPGQGGTTKRKTKVLRDNGFNCLWESNSNFPEELKFDIKCPSLSHIRLHVKEGTGVKDALNDIVEAVRDCKKVQEMDAESLSMMQGCETALSRIRKRGDPDLIGQFCCPAFALGQGYRLINLLDDTGMQLSNAKLFVQIKTENLYD